ncbi:hypothetical protein GCM10025868_29960 [Angustibacter aerolatus]|uniref:beta-galactosidase n=1 Tax=Angustibacter aerolatus TaxID=1162965 RepID=A0ABQ6JHN6_9ACTN|nr:beta-galactosidase small subunit [Angustibacter aerolatus]GMA87746.1 hypothetical protein GCM10025868_29960 [Angustibacter aerolatus]
MASSGGGGRGVVRLGPVTLDADTGALVAVGEPAGRLVRRRPVAGADRQRRDRVAAHPAAATWRAGGLHRLQQRTVGVDVEGARVVVRTRLAPPALRCALDVTAVWTADAGRAEVEPTVTPTGEWPDTWPRLGVAMALPGGSSGLEQVEWLGLGPDEAYPDSDEGARYGLWSRGVFGMQTRYVRPQENGHRPGTRWARLAGEAGALVVEATGGGSFGLTVRPWSVAALTAADHVGDLVPDGRTWLHLDHAHHGLGTHACGPDVFEPYVLRPRAATFGFRFTAG